MIRIVLLLLVGLIYFPSMVNAQNIEKNEEKEIVYSKEWITGVKLHTSGYGLFMSFGKIIDRSNKRLYNFELQEIKHVKQVSSRSKHSAGNSQSFFYGKQNSFYNLNFNYIREKVLAEKGRKSSIVISWRYGGGVSMGLLKPYYLRLDKGDGEFVSQKYETDKDLFLDFNDILGSAGFFKGIGETEIIPGATVQSSFLFDWAVYNQFIKAVEVGVMVNLYYKRVPIMIDVENNFLIGNLYLKMLFGERKE